MGLRDVWCSSGDSDVRPGLESSSLKDSLHKWQPFVIHSLSFYSAFTGCAALKDVLHLSAPQNFLSPRSLHPLTNAPTVPSSIQLCYLKLQKRIHFIYYVSFRTLSLTSLENILSSYQPWPFSLASLWPPKSYPSPYIYCATSMCWTLCYTPHIPFVI